MRNTGNRGIEAVHGVFRGGTTSLPITSPNLSFQQFMSRMNKAIQINRAEHNLKQVEGSTIVASRKKRLTNASNSSDLHGPGIKDYTKPDLLPKFIADLNDACNEGDRQAKEAIENLAPQMVETLKEHKEWEVPTLCTEKKPVHTKLYLEEGSTANLPEDIHSKLIEHVLGPIRDKESDGTKANFDVHEEVQQAASTLIADMTIEPRVDVEIKGQVIEVEGTKVSVTTILKDLQPHCEHPSKDRSKRFAAGDLFADKEIPSEHNIAEYQYWAIYPGNKYLCNMRTFLLGQILCIFQDSQPCRSSCRENPSTKVILTVFQYNSEMTSYSPHGRTGLMSASSALLSDLTSAVIADGSNNIKVDQDILRKLDITPYHDDLDISLPLCGSEASCTSSAVPEDSDPCIVEKIVKKRYNAHREQYEYLVKWQGYVSAENTWEPPNNIPNSILQAFESNLVQSKTGNVGQTRREGLRQNRKSANKEGFILNI